MLAIPSARPSEISPHSSAWYVVGGVGQRRSCRALGWCYIPYCVYGIDPVLVSQAVRHARPRNKVGALDSRSGVLAASWLDSEGAG